MNTKPLLHRAGRMLPFGSLLLLFLTHWCGLSSGQTPAWQWAVSAGGGLNDEGSAIAVNGQGHVYIAGNQRGAVFGSGTAHQTAVAAEGGFIARFDGTGSLVWVRGIAGASVTGIALDTEQQVIVSGYFSSSVTFAPGESSPVTFTAAANTTDSFLAKYNDGGGLIWAQQLDKHHDHDYPADISVDSRNYITLAGVAYETPSQMHSFLDQWNSTGIRLWSRGGWTYTACVTSDAAGGCYAAGVKGTENNQQLALASYSSAGALQWEISTAGSGGTSVVRPASIHNDGAGHIYVSGDYLGTVIFGSGESAETHLSTGSYTPFLAKYNDSGTLIWVRETGGRCAAVDSGRAVYAAGFTTLQKFDLDGNLVWTRTDASSGPGYVNDLYIDAERDLYVTGSFTNDIVFDPGTSHEQQLFSAGQYDVFAACMSLRGPVISGVLFFYPSHVLIEGAELTFLDLGTTTTNATGYYAMEVPRGWSGTLTPEVTGLDFENPSRTFENVITDQLYQDFWIIGEAEVPISGNVFQMPGQVMMEGATLEFSSGGGSVQTDASGYYELMVPYRWSGTVTPGLEGYTFSPESVTYSEVIRGWLDQDYEVHSTHADDTDEPADADAFELLNNYPNPFNSSTLIRYRLGRPQIISLQVYDAAGRSAGCLYEGLKEAGYHDVRWPAANASAHEMPSGIYICRLQGEAGSVSRKFLYLK